MNIQLKNINASLYKPYLKESLSRDEINTLKHNMTALFDRLNDQETDEHNKNIVADFLTNTYYQKTNEINTAERKDLVIYSGKTSNTPIWVIMEVKRPNDKLGMVESDNINKKAMHELVHYYLHERHIKGNLEIRHLVITDVYQWYIFDAVEFERVFSENKPFLKQYKEWTAGILPSKNTDWLYREIIKPFIEQSTETLTCTHFDLRQYEKIARVEKHDEDIKLLQLYKIFSPRHLLKLPTLNDSNTLNADFYNELLHLLGLEEVKDGNKRVIKRKRTGRHIGSMIENTIHILLRNKRTKVERPDLWEEAGEEEQIFSIALELCITWLNRILFLKLLEGQLVQYHKRNYNFAFLHYDKIKDFDELDELCFEVLAVKPEERSPTVKAKFGNLPYLNSALFEQTDLEIQTIQISSLKNRLEMPLYEATVLRDGKGKRLEGKKNTLEYLFNFLDAYNFSSDTTTEIQEVSKSIINAAVLGLIFEKINGYKDGSFYTPSFLTTYMCKSTIRKIVVEKFETVFNKPIKNFEQLKDLIDPTDKTVRQQANEIINNIKICDPSVGSGHFLVSALNELIAIKSELKILNHHDGTRIKEYKIVSEKDELVVTDKETDELFSYIPNKKGRPIEEVQLLQESLFKEKRILIEKCLFGIDINPKSALICRLRLWIELLKNAYYTTESNYQYLETLPNIDINIKVGNSLLSKFDTHFNLFEEIEIKSLLKQYKQVNTRYWSCADYDERKKCRDEMRQLKTQLESYTIPQDIDYEIYSRKKKEFETFGDSFGNTRIPNDAFKVLTKMNKEVQALQQKYEENYRTIYASSIEWAIEFPQILDEDGRFIGFDAVVGNPPYFSVGRDPKLGHVSNNYQTYSATGDIYMLFVERCLKIVAKNRYISLVISNKWLSTSAGENLRKFLTTVANPIELIDFGQNLLFSNAIVHTNILEVQNAPFNNQLSAIRIAEKQVFDHKNKLEDYVADKFTQLDVLQNGWRFASNAAIELRNRLEERHKRLKDWYVKINFGLKTGFNEAFIITGTQREALLRQDKRNADIIKPILRGRDTRRYFCNYADLWLINTFNGYSENISDEKNDIVQVADNQYIFTNEQGEQKTAKRLEKVRGKLYRVDRVDVQTDYPTIFAHLQQFEAALRAREDQGVHWTNLRNCAYEADFLLPKVIFSEIVSEPQFYYDTQQYYPEATVFCMVGEKLKYLTALLNSNVVTFLFKNFYMGGELVGKIRYKKAFLEQVPIPTPTETQEQAICALVDKIIAAKKIDNEANTHHLETQINDLVIQLYELTPLEIQEI